MPIFSAYNVLGASIESGEITNNAVGINQLGDVDKLELLETLEYTNETTKTTATLKVCDYYLVKYLLENKTAGANEVYLRLNEDASADYSYLAEVNAVLTKYSAATSAMIQALHDNRTNCGELVFNGNTKSSVTLYFSSRGVSGTAWGAAYKNIVRGWLEGLANNTQLGKLRIFSTGIMTGKVQVFGGFIL